MDTFQMNPKAIRADMAFHHPHDKQAFCRMHHVKRIPTGLHTPWPNCTTVQEMSLGTRGYRLQKPGPDHSGTNHSCPVKTQVTLSGKTPMELAMGRRPRDLLDPASRNPEQLTSTPTNQNLLNEEKQKLVVTIHLEVQQREDIRRDLAERMKLVPPDLRTGEHVFYWQEDPSKIEQGGKSGKWLMAPWLLSTQVRPYFRQTQAS